MALILIGGSDDVNQTLTHAAVLSAEFDEIKQFGTASEAFNLLCSFSFVGPGLELDLTILNSLSDLSLLDRLQGVGLELDSPFDIGDQVGVSILERGLLALKALTMLDDEFLFQGAGIDIPQFLSKLVEVGEVHLNIDIRCLIVVSEHAHQGFKGISQNVGTFGLQQFIDFFEMDWQHFIIDNLNTFFAQSIGLIAE